MTDCDPFPKSSNDNQNDGVDLWLRELQSTSITPSDEMLASIIQAADDVLERRQNLRVTVKKRSKFFFDFKPLWENWPAVSSLACAGIFGFFIGFNGNTTLTSPLNLYLGAETSLNSLEDEIFLIATSFYDLEESLQ